MAFALGGSGILLGILAKQALKGTLFNPMIVQDIGAAAGAAGDVARSVTGGMGKIAGPLIGITAALGGITHGLNKAQEAEAAGHEKEASSRRWGTILGAIAGAGLVVGGLALSPFTLGASLTATAAGVGAMGGAMAMGDIAPNLMGTVGMAEGAVVQRSSDGVNAKVGEGKYDELVSPLPPGGIEVQGQKDIIKELKGTSILIGDLIEAVKKSKPILVKDALSAAGFVNKGDIPTGY